MENEIAARYQKVREITMKLVQKLHPEDTVVQPIVDVSPPKWHIAHTTWFFENFILKNYINGFKPFHPIYDFLFNSYYQSQGTRVQRDMRGNHPRPLLDDIFKYRASIDCQMLDLLNSRQANARLLELIELGIQHEQQHQELLVTDLKYIWGLSPLYPVFQSSAVPIKVNAAFLRWLPVEEGMYETGESGVEFHYDNESPVHKTWLDNFEIGSRPVTVGEYVEFIDSGGYTQWQHWLHEGWQWLASIDLKAPMYWKKLNGKWHIYTLTGLRILNEDETVTHVSFYEADAFARWKRMRLPTEQEWETAAKKYGRNDLISNFQDNNFFHPTTVTGNDTAFLGQVWEWTNSAYLPYPGFRPWEGDIGEYNGKFMVNQMVLRGGSCITPKDHIRISYRNFFHPHLRWQFTGIRLAKNI